VQQAALWATLLLLQCFPKYISVEDLWHMG